MTIDQQADRVHVGTDEITFHVTSGMSGDTLVAADVHIPAGGGPPAMHRHAPEEPYLVNDGRARALRRKRVMALAARHGIEITGPVPGSG